MSVTAVRVKVRVSGVVRDIGESVNAVHERGGKRVAWTAT